MSECTHKWNLVRSFQAAWCSGEYEREAKGWFAKKVKMISADDYHYARIDEFICTYCLEEKNKFREVKGYLLAKPVWWSEALKESYDWTGDPSFGDEGPYDFERFRAEKDGG